MNRCLLPLSLSLLALAPVAAAGDAAWDVSARAAAPAAAANPVAGGAIVLSPGGAIEIFKGGRIEFPRTGTKLGAGRY